MRIAVLLLLNLLAQHVSANDLLWEKLKTEADLVVLMRHTQPAAGNPLTWDESGSCKGESLIASHRVQPLSGLRVATGFGRWLTSR